MTKQECYEQGFLDGLKAYAWWKDGVEVVGTTGRTLRDAQQNYKSTWNFLPPKEIQNGL